MLISFASSPFCKQPVTHFVSLAFSDFCDFSGAVATRTKAMNGMINVLAGLQTRRSGDIRGVKA